MLYNVGMVGWTAMPSAFYVISRVLTRLISSQMAGSCLTSTISCMGGCPTAALDATPATVQYIVANLLDPDPVQDKKT